jgi:hypothetical protein
MKYYPAQRPHKGKDNIFKHKSGFHAEILIFAYLSSEPI